MSRLRDEPWKTIVEEFRKGSVDALEKLLTHEVAGVRREAVETCLEEGRAAAAPALLRHLPNEVDPTVRAPLIRSLGQLGHEEAEPELLALRNGADRRAAYEALAALALPASESAFVEGLACDDSHVQIASLRGIGRLNAKDQARHVRPLLRRVPLARTAIETLGLLADRESIEALRRRVDDIDEDVRVAAACALLRMGDRAGVRTAVREGVSPALSWELAALELPEVAKNLRETLLRERLVSAAELRAKALGPGAVLVIGREQHLRPAPARSSVADAIVDLAEREGMGFVVENGRIRMVRRIEAAEWWRARIGN